MRARTFAAGIAMAIVGSLALFGSAGAQNEPYPIELKVGESFDVCASGLLGCPATSPICDNPEVAIPVDVPGSGLGFRGVGPGTTLCSAADRGYGNRRVFRITVR